VVGLASSGACHPVADVERRLSLRADVERDARAAVAERDRNIEPVADCLDRGWDAVAPRFVQDLLDQVRPLTRGVQQVGAGGFDEHALGAGADQRPLVVHQQTTAGRQRRGQLHHLRRTRAAVLQHLLHRLAISH
jgi:hypothetical protein